MRYKSDHMNQIQLYPHQCFSWHSRKCGVPVDLHFIDLHRLSKSQNIPLFIGLKIACPTEGECSSREVGARIGHTEVCRRVRNTATTPVILSGGCRPTVVHSTNGRRRGRPGRCSSPVAYNFLHFLRFNLSHVRYCTIGLVFLEKIFNFNAAVNKGVSHRLKHQKRWVRCFFHHRLVVFHKSECFQTLKIRKNFGRSAFVAPISKLHRN